RVAAGLQTEHGAPVVEQVELDVAAAADQLVAALLLGPGELHPLPHNGREHGEESLADRADEGEVALLVAAVEIIEKDPADTSRLSPMLEKEVFVAPCLEALITVAAVGCAGRRKRGMKLLGRG